MLYIPGDHQNLPWLAANTILYVRGGSHAYGTNLPTSDEDFRGVAIAPREYYLGFSKVWEQATAQAPHPDVIVYELKKFMGLAADCNPNIIEFLFTDLSDHLHVTPIGQILLDHREAFLSRRAGHTFRGYAISQLKRIKTHRRWLMTPPTHKPTRSEFNLPERTLVPADQLAAAEAAIRKEIDSWEVDLSGLDDARRIQIMENIATLVEKLAVTPDEKWNRAARLLSFDDNMLEVLTRERAYTSALQEWQHYEDWKRKRNEARAALEAKHGFDTKHGMHLCRLLRMGREILLDGKVIVKRPDAAELLAIRHGEWSYDQLVEWAERQDVEIQGLYMTSPLPKVPNPSVLDQLCERLIVAQWELSA